MRKDWIFPYIGQVLAREATKRRDAHVAKVAWWEKKKAEVMDNIRASGMTFNESLASTYVLKGNMASDVNIDPTMRDHLREAHSKLEEHQRKVVEYNSWVQVLTANPEKILDLNQEDYTYFFGEQIK